MSETEESVATAAPSTSGATTAPARTAAEWAEPRVPLSLRLSRYALPAILIVFIIVFSIISPTTFATIDNFRTILVTQSVLAILAIGACIPLIVGEFDLSIGANLGLGVVLSSGLMVKEGLPVVPAVLITLAVCTLVGLVNGLFVAKVGINAFIVTLGMASIIGGGVLWYSDGTTFSGLPPEFTAFGRGSLAGIPNPVLVLIAVGLIAWFVLAMTPVGRFLYAVGGSKEASRLSGLRVARLTIGAFTMTGLVAGVAGVLLASTLGSGTPSLGASFLLPAFAAAFLGATAFKPGVFNIPGTIVAVFTIQTGIVGLQIAGAPYFIDQVFTGVILIIAIVATRFLYKQAL